MKALMTLTEAAEEASVSVATIRRAVAASDPNAFPHPLKAKRLSVAPKKGEPAKPGPYRIRDVDLADWISRLDDA